MNLADYMTPDQAAAKWDVHRSMVYRWIAEGRIPSEQALGRTVIPRSARKPRPRKPWSQKPQ